MKIFTNKNIVQKIIIAIVIVLSFNFIIPNYSQAGFGGVLMGPIIDFLAGLGDAVMSALQFFMYDGNINVGSTVGGAVTGALTIVNPFASFLLMRSDSNFDSKLEEYDMNVTTEELKENIERNPNTEDYGGADIPINADEFDKGWLGWIPGSLLDKDYGVPIIKYTPEKIFANKVPSLDVNFINPQKWNNQAMDDKSVTQALHSTIANWYIALRNLAIVALLSVLLYVGIRMVISSTASDKAKYKQMLMDWVIALCIVFFLHYIMSFILSVTQMITEGIDSGTEVIVQLTDSTNGEKFFKTDLTGLCRLQIQYSDLGARMIYLIFYIALVIYTVMFTWTYVKRAILMAFLTLMAPLVAITYPIDKISDGKAQAYGIWLKEFIFNALLQPFHLIIYTVFLGAASEIAVKNPIYAILFLAFIIPAEKLLRKMFGFEKSSTAGAMSTAAGMFGGAAAFKAANGILGKGKKSSGSGQGGKDKIRTKNPVKDKNEIGKDFTAFAQKNKNGANKNVSAGNTTQPMLSDEENQEMSSLREELDNADYNDMYLNPEAYQAKQDRLAELERKQPQSQLQRQTNAQTNNGQNQEGSGGYEVIRRANNNNIGNSGNSNQEFTEGFENLEEIGNDSVPRSVIRGVKNVAKSGIKYTGKKLKHRFASREGWKENAKFAGRMAVRGVSAATIGAVGLGMGIAGDDLEDVLKFGAAGAALGGTVVGGRLADAGGRVMHNANMAFQEGYYGNRNAALMAQQYRQYYNDEDKREFFGEEFEVEGKELDDIMTRAANINNQGITDDKAVKQTIKLEDSIMKEMKNNKNLEMSDEEKAKAAHEQAITIAKVADYFDTGKLMTSEQYRQGVYKHFENGLKKVNPEMSQKDLDIQKENMMKLLKKYKKID